MRLSEFFAVTGLAVFRINRSRFGVVDDLLLHCSHEKVKRSVLFSAMTALLCVYFAFLIVAQFTDVFYYVTEDNRFFYGSLYKLSLVPLVLIMLLNIVGVIIRRKIIILLEFKPGRLNKVIWCDEEIDYDKADSISFALGKDMHELGLIYHDSSYYESLYFQYREQFVIHSDFRYFSATEYSVNDFITAIKNREL